MHSLSLSSKSGIKSDLVPDSPEKGIVSKSFAALKVTCKVIGKVAATVFLMIANMFVRTYQNVRERYIDKVKLYTTISEGRKLTTKPSERHSLTAVSLKEAKRDAALYTAVVTPFLLFKDILWGGVVQGAIGAVLVAAGETEKHEDQVENGLMIRKGETGPEALIRHLWRPLEMQEKH